MPLSVRLFTFLTITILTTGCVSFLNATSKGPIETDPTERSFGGLLDDKRLSTVIAVNIKKADEQLDRSNIKVSTYNAIVLLTGQVPTIEMRELAGKVARDVHKVRIVHNELEVMPNISFFQRTKDKWLDTKIDTKLFTSRQVKSQKVKVVVQNKIVYLMGTLDTEQADLITEIVSRTKGVKKVIRALEYSEDILDSETAAQNEIAAEKENSSFLAAPLNKTVNSDTEFGNSDSGNSFVFEEDGTAIEDKARSKKSNAQTTQDIIGNTAEQLDTENTNNIKENSVGENLETFSDL